jgi:hypothetical protein
MELYDDFYFIYTLVGPPYIKSFIHYFPNIPNGLNIVVITNTPELFDGIETDFNLIVVNLDSLREDWSIEHEKFIIEYDENSYFEKLRLIGINPQNLRENNISRNIRITSPITGYVSKVNVNIGKYLNPADVLFELIDPRDIHLNLNVYEKDLEKLSIGQKLTAFTNNLFTFVIRVCSS